MRKFLSILKAVTVIIPVVEGLAYGVKRAYEGIREAFRPQDPPTPGGMR